MPRGGKGKTKKKVKEPSSEEKEDEHLRIKQEHKLFLEVAELSRDLQNVKIEQDRNSIETEKTKKVQQSINDLPEDVKLFSQAGRMFIQQERSEVKRRLKSDEYYQSVQNSKRLYLHHATSAIKLKEAQKNFVESKKKK
eukprot:Filipodium_phascolosomae@DN2433_c0_g1_i3.p1